MKEHTHTKYTSARFILNAQNHNIIDGFCFIMGYQLNGYNYMECISKNTFECVSPLIHCSLIRLPTKCAQFDLMLCDAMQCNALQLPTIFFILSVVSLCPESLSINFKRHSYIFQLISYVTFVQIYCRNLYVCQFNGIIQF